MVNDARGEGAALDPDLSARTGVGPTPATDFA
jgi:hypothetical protein